MTKGKYARMEQQKYMFGKWLKQDVIDLVKNKGPLTRSEIVKELEKKGAHINSINYIVRRLYNERVLIKHPKLEDMRQVYYALNDG